VTRRVGVVDNARNRDETDLRRVTGIRMAKRRRAKGLLKNNLVNSFAGHSEHSEESLRDLWTRSFAALRMTWLKSLNLFLHKP
jgi:hypothetical protein